MTVDSPATEAASALRRSLARLHRRLRLQSRTTGLSATKLSILGQLHRDGARHPKDLAHGEGVQPQSITRALAELETAGLVTRRQDESDRRHSQIEITSEGRHVIVQDARGRTRWLALAMDANLTALEKDLLSLAIPLLDKLAEAPSGGSSD